MIFYPTNICVSHHRLRGDQRREHRDSHSQNHHLVDH